MDAIATLEKQLDDIDADEACASVTRAVDIAIGGEGVATRLSAV